MSTITYDVYDKVSRLVEFATGEPHGDGMLVTDVITGYAEPGYGSDEDIIVLGDWNDKTEYRDGKHVVLDDLPSRLFNSLTRVGAQCEWLDEWMQCTGCFRALRTSGDSYSWKSFYVDTEDGPVCGDCAVGDGEAALTGYDSFNESTYSYVNNPRRAVTWGGGAHLKSLGFAKWEPGDEHDYQSGWHSHMNDDPATIMPTIHAVHPTAEVVFLLDEASQFYVGFSAYFRVPTVGTDDES